MSRSVSFNVLATVTVDDDGHAELTYDWSDSCLGEWSDESSDHEDTPFASAVCVLLDEHIEASKSIDVGFVPGCWCVVRDGVLGEPEQFGAAYPTRKVAERLLASMSEHWPGLRLGRITSDGELRQVEVVA